MKRLIQSILVMLFSLPLFAQRTLPPLKVQDSLNIIGEDPKILLNGVEFEGAGESSTYDGNSPTTVTVGGLVAGSNISGMELSAILSAILAPYVAPAFTSFSMSGQSSTMEVGDSIMGDQNFVFTFSNSGNVQANTLDIYEVTEARYLEINQPTTSPLTLDVGKVKYNTAASHSYRAEANNTQGGTFQSSNFTINWRWRRHWGFTDAIPATTDDIVNLSGNELSGNNNKTVNSGSPEGDQYFSYSYPTSFGALTSIMVNGFQAIDAFTRTTVSHTNAFGVTTDYYLYISNNQYNSSSTIIFD